MRERKLSPRTKSGEEETLNQLTEDQCDARSQGGKMGVTANKYGVPFWSDENNVELGSVDVCRPCKYNKTHQFEHIKMVNLVASYISVFKKVNVTRNFILYSVRV